MRSSKRILLLLGLCLLLLAAVVIFLGRSWPDDVASFGTDIFPPSVQLNGQMLHRTGTAVRKSWFRPIYLAALYLPEDVTMPGGVAPTHTLWRIHLVQLADQDFKKRCFEWYIGMERSHPDPPPQLKHAFDTLCALTRDLGPGDTLLLTHVPGEGTRVAVNGKTLRTIQGEVFAGALLASWTGKQPVAGRRFKEEILGLR